MVPWGDSGIVPWVDSGIVFSSSKDSEGRLNLHVLCAQMLLKDDVRKIQQLRVHVTIE